MFRALAQGGKVNLQNIDVGKVRVQIGNTLPPDVVQRIAGSLADVIFPAASAKKSFGYKNPVEAEVGEHIWSRIQALGRSGKQFEDGVAYVNDEKEADDARDIVQGIDPALRSQGCGGGGGGFTARRSIPIERRHWIACKQGHYMTQYGIAYVHTNGAVAMFQHGRPAQCLCGALHMA